MPQSFETTQWNVVVAAGAGEGATSLESKAALESLCRSYWTPLYAYVRRKGYSVSDAEDLVQGFFARLLQRNDLGSAQKEKGRFRSYLLGAMKHYLINEWRRSSAEKRGSQRVIVMDEEALAQVSSKLKSNSASPDIFYDRQWARSLLHRALSRLEDEWKVNGKGDLFHLLKGYLVEGAGEKSQAEIAAEFGMNEGAVKQTVFRLRRRFQRLLRQEIADTVATTDEIESELRYLVAALRK